MKYLKKSAILVPFLLLVLAGRAPDARAAGFLVYDLSGEAMGKASAVTASVNEPAAVFFNPAALAFMNGYQVSAGTVFITAKNSFEPAGGGADVSAEPGVFFLPTIYGMARVNKWFSLGLGVYTAFGLGIEWPHDWIGRESSIAADIETVTFSPTFSFRTCRYLSIAAGVNVIRATVDMTNGLPAAIGGTVQIGGATWGVGAHAGILARFIPDVFHFGVTYHSRAKLSFDGKADFAPEHEEFSYDLQDQGGKAAITLPDILSFGLMYRPIKPLTITFDTNLVLWSTYKELRLDFELREDQVMPRNWKDVVTVRLGLDWATPLPGFHARLGFIYDMNPSPKETLAPSLPDAHRVDLALGVGYSWKWLKVDVGYLLVYFLPSESTTGAEGPEGTYNAMAHLLALTITARFGHEPKPKVLPPVVRPVRPAARPRAERPRERRVVRPVPPPRREPPRKKRRPAARPGEAAPERQPAVPPRGAPDRPAKPATNPPPN